MICVVLLGLLCTILFHWIVKPRAENLINSGGGGRSDSLNDSSDRNGDNVADDISVERMSVLSWLREPQFYQVRIALIITLTKVLYTVYYQLLF